ncbi:ABC transporter substrate-binding protein [Acetonema longum]|uniref:ABC transporter substrate-binding protein n=1 Tax=Acetonema longum TaxID=2374 RepID=UPI00058F7D54
MTVKIHRIGAGVCLAVLLILHLTGCSFRSAGPLPSAAPDNAYLTVVDDAGRTVILAKKPERVVILSASLVDLYYAVGGRAVGRLDSKTLALSPEAQALPLVGMVGNVNLEALISLQPDLVIGLQGAGEQLIPVMESSRIPYLLLRMKTYEDVRQKMKLFGDIAGTGPQAGEKAADLDSRVQATIQQLPVASKKVVILHATAKTVTVELENTIAGDVAKMLRLNNIAAGSRALDGNPDMTPYSMEKLIEADPDLVMITLMGNHESIERRLRADVESNPAWTSLRAVKSKQIFFLPTGLYWLNPGIRYDEAVLQMARIVYPEVFKHGK